MSHGHRNASSEIAHLVAEIRKSTPEEILADHGIVILGNTNVYDPTENRTFVSINAWAAYVVQQEIDEWEDDEHDTGKWDEHED